MTVLSLLTWILSYFFCKSVNVMYIVMSVCTFFLISLTANIASDVPLYRNGIKRFLPNGCFSPDPALYNNLLDLHSKWHQLYPFIIHAILNVSLDRKQCTHTIRPLHCHLSYTRMQKCCIESHSTSIPPSSKQSIKLTVLHYVCML